jgi:periplasmic divalent cation tolerance protein
MRGDDVVVMLTSVGTEDQGLDVGEALVVRGQAACVNMVPSVRSIYRWKGKVCEDTEYILIIKTLARHFKGVSDTIREINTYELPEILSFSVRDAEERFCQWIVKGVAKKPGGVRKARRKPVISKRRKRPVQVRK